MPNINTTLIHLDAFETPLNVGDRVIYRTRISSRMEVGVIASFTATCARVVPSHWQNSINKVGIGPKDFPTYNAPKHLLVNVEKLMSTPLLAAKWADLLFPAQLLSQTV